MIQPNLVCKKEHKQNKIALTLNNYNKYYDNTRFDKLDLVIEHDETIIKDLKYITLDDEELPIFENKITIKNDNKFSQKGLVGYITYELLNLHSTKLPFINTTCNGQRFVLLNTSEYPNILSTKSRIISQNKYLQVFVETTKDTALFKIASTKNILPYKVHDFKIIIIKDGVEIFERTFEKYIDYEFKIGSLENLTKYRFNIQFEYNDEPYLFNGGNFWTKPGTVGTPTIEVQNIKEDSCDICLVEFEGGNQNNTIEVYLSKNGRIQKTVSFENNASGMSSHASGMKIHVDNLEFDTEYTINYRVLDNIDDEKMYYDIIQFKTNKPELVVELKRTSDNNAVNFIVTQLDNVSKTWKVVIKLNNVDEKIVIYNNPVLFKLPDNTSTYLVGDIYLNDGFINNILHKQEIFNII